jgi:hypothetical protein
MSIVYALFFETGDFCCFTTESSQQSDSVPNSIWKEIGMSEWHAQYEVLHKIPLLDVVGDTISWIDRP